MMKLKKVVPSSLWAKLLNTLIDICIILIILITKEKKNQCLIGCLINLVPTCHVMFLITNEYSLSSVDEDIQTDDTSLNVE